MKGNEHAVTVNLKKGNEYLFKYFLDKNSWLIEKESDKSDQAISTMTYLHNCKCVNYVILLNCFVMLIKVFETTFASLKPYKSRSNQNKNF